jgi:hypothetical protein
MSPSAGLGGVPVKTSAGCAAGLALCSAAGLVPSGPGLGVGAGVISGESPAASFFRLRTDSRVIVSRKATARAMSPSADAMGALATMPSACPAGLTLGSAAGLVPAGPGLGVGAGVISGKSPAAFPAPTMVVVTFGMGAAAWMAPRRPAAPPAPMSELVGLFGFVGGPGGGAPPEPVELGVGVGLEDAEDVGLADAEDVGLEDAEDVGLTDAEGVGLEDAEDVGLVVGAGDVESVGLGVDVGGGDVEGAGLSLVVGAGVDGDGLGVSEGLGVALAAAGEGEGEESTALANAGLCELADSPETRRPPVTRPATTARRRATFM